MNGVRKRAGAVTAEFSVVLVLFLLIACGALELARGLYVLNMTAVVTQRAAQLAAYTDYTNSAAMQAVRQRAVLRSDPGTLIFGDPVSDAHVRIDYLSLAGPNGAILVPIANASLPSCPANNRINCTLNPYGAACIRVVRARICDPAVTDTCERIAYRSVLPLAQLPYLLPMATTVVSAESLGAAPGAAPCP